ncbi:MAG: hypothetical protein ACE5NW_11405 [Acidiferrobacterales bacterium]
MWQFVSKLGPKTLTILIAIALILVAAVITYAISVGHPVNFFGLYIGQANQELHSEIAVMKSQIRVLRKKLDERPTQEDVNKLKAEIANALISSDLPGVWDAAMSKDQVENTIKAMKKSTDEYDEFKGSSDFVFLRLEREISKSGGAINTKIAEGYDREVFQLIQSALQAINAFRGNLDGEQVSTNRALEVFQREYNQKVSEELQLKPRGFFGRRTLYIIRDQYWKIIEES